MLWPRSFLPILVLTGFVTISQASSDEKLPAIWRKTMTNDPSTNYLLGKYSQPLPCKAEEAGRVLTLIRLLGAGCEKATVNKERFSIFIEQSGITKLGKSELKELSDNVSAKFDGFDYDTLAHLCSGIDYLFGQKGVLGRSLMVAGTGEPTLPNDPANPYFRIPPVQPESP